MYVLKISYFENERVYEKKNIFINQFLFDNIKMSYNKQLIHLNPKKYL